MFLLLFWRFAPESVWKNSHDVRSGVFWGFVLSSLVFSSTSFFFLKRYRSGSNRTPPRTHLFCLFFFSFCVPPRLFFARFGRASCFLAVFRGAILGPVRFWDSPGTCSEALFLGREAAGVFVCFSCLVVFFPLLFCFAATHFFSPSRWSRRSGQRVISPAPRPSEGEGSASSAEGWSPPFLGFCRLFLIARGSQGPSDTASKAFCLGRGLFTGPLRPFFTRTFVPPQFFFLLSFSFLALGARVRIG